MVNKMLGSRYEIIQPLSKGGFGTTYLAEDTKYPDNLKCVVKKLHSNAENPEFLKISRRMFAKEAKTLAKLGKHNQIPQLLAYFEEDKEFYLVQQYIRGVTLTNELVVDQPWSEAKTIDFLRDLLTVVDFIHQSKVIHRDIKPDNLIRRALDNKLVLVDFGTVKEVMLTQSQAIASTVAIGTQGYMPTEQARGKPRFASDIYAVGMIAIQALTGVHPLQLPEDENGETLWLDRAQCSPRLGEIISKMICYHFKDRYHSAQEILTNLDILQNRLINSTNKDVTGIIMPTEQNVTPLHRRNPAAEATKIEAIAKPKSKQTLTIALSIGVLTAATLAGGLLFGKGLGKSAELKQAEAKAATGEYAQAIALVQDISPTTEIEQQIDLWSEQLLDEAKIKYDRQGDLETARRKIESIPDSSRLKTTALSSLTEWSQEYEFNRSIVQIATENLQQEQWQKAIQEAAQIQGNTFYWEQQSARIIQAAKLGEQSNPGVVDLCSKALDFCN
ncbi:MAG: serine/threonine-protein kinase [Cyanobacteria bacterium J06600_6]